VVKTSRRDTWKKIDFIKSLNLYKRIKDPEVPIDCVKHGKFMFSPESHLRNKG
jgi:hypothetical protein